MNVPNKWINYARTYVSELCPRELIPAYTELLAITDKIIVLEKRIQFTKVTNGNTFILDKQLLDLKNKYMTLQAEIIEQKKSMGITCGWEKS